ncbi:MAG: GAF domain-containing protein [Aquificales bacterium]|nr:GAF domain-containing protein [Aquificales bacterium]
MQRKRARTAFNLGLLITVASGLVVLGTFLLQTLSGENYYVWITAVGIAGGIITMVLARRGNTLAAALALVTALFVIAFLYVVTFETITTMLTIIMIILSLGIVTQIFPSEKVRRAIIVIVLIGVSLIILDQLWPVTRTSPPPQTQNIIVISGVIIILLLTFIVIRQFPSYSLRSKLIGATLAVALIAVAVVAFGVNIFTTQAITNQVGANLNTLTGSQALAIGEFLARKINTLEALSTNQIIIQGAQEKNASYADSDDPPSRQIAIATGQWADTTEEDEIVKSILENDIAADLNRFQTLFPDNVQLLVTDKYGAQIAATQRTRDYFKGDESWWADTYARGFGSTYIGEPTYDSRSRAYSIIMAIPIHGTTEDGSGEIIGVLQTIVSLDALGDILLNSRFGETGLIEIFLEGDRHLVVDEQGEISIKNSTLNPEAVEFVKNSDESFIVTKFEGTSHFLSSAFMNTLAHEPVVDRLKWAILATQHADEILEPVSQQQRINTILGIIVVVFAGVVAAYVGARISKPITNLTNIAEEVAAGNLDIQAPIETQDEIGILAASFNDMTAQLRDSITTLEQRVNNRTQALATTVIVGQKLSTILDEDELVTAVAQQVRDSFNYYQAQIYLLTEDKQTLVMASGTGEAGRQMMAQGHTLQVGAGMVGAAAQYNIIELAPDVSQEENWLPNPLLPDTKAEIAVPIAIGDEVLGVLDVQHHVVNRLQIEDAELLQSVSSQVAVALRNARLYQETEQQARSEALLRSINQKITSTTDMETAMKVAIRELGEALGTRQTSIRLGHHEAQNDAPPTTNGNNGKSNA